MSDQSTVSQDSRSVGASGATAQPGRREWLGLSVILLAAFIELLDVTVVTVAVPDIQSDLRATYSAAQWMLAAYQLAFAAGLITGGRLGDIYGCRKIFVVGVVWFSVASLLCAVAPTAVLLIAFRAAQGLGAALMFPQVVSLIHLTFTGKSRAAAFGALGAVTGMAGVAGPLLGGALIELDVLNSGWRSIFFINIPIGVVACVGAMLFVSERRAPDRPRLDLFGALLVTVAVVLLVFPVVQGNDAEWAWWIWVLLALSVPAGVLFLVHQRAVMRNGGSPVMDLNMFRGNRFNWGLVLQLTCFAGVSSLFLVLALTLEAGEGYSAWKTGLAFMPIAIGMGMASGLAIPLLPRLGRIVIQIGCVVMIVGLLGLIWTLHSQAGDLDFWELVPAEVVVGLGLGTIVTTVNDVVLAEAVGPSTGSASGVQATAGTAGNAVGVAVLGAIFVALLVGNASSVAREQGPDLRQNLVTARVPASEAANLVDRSVVCFREQADADDPTVPVASCQALFQQADQVGGPEVATLVQEHVTGVNAWHFATSLANSLWYEVAVFVLAFLLAFAVPRRQGIVAGTAH